MADIIQSLNYDTRPFPREERRRGALPAIVEAGVQQELFFLNAVYENVNANVLTLEQAKEIMWMISNPNTLFDEAVDIVFSEQAEPMKEVLEDCVIEDLPISGYPVFPKKLIYESAKPDSVYIPLHWNRVFGESTDSLAASMNQRMDYLENELYSYFESYGERGFEDDESVIYLESSNPESEMFLKDYLRIVTEAAAITGRFSAEDGVSILSFLEACLVDETVAAMAPIVVPGEGEILTKNPDHRKPIETNIIIPEDAATTESVINALLHENGWYTMEAVNLRKNNVVFDSIARKLFNDIKGMLRLSNPENPDESFKSALNIGKDRYRFSFNDTNDPKTERVVRSRILAVGFKPVKKGNIVTEYVMHKKPITIEVEFEDIQTGIDISYTEDITTESTSTNDGVTYYAPIISLEKDNAMKDQLISIFESAGYMEDLTQRIEETSTYDRLQSIRNNWEEDSVISEACDTLMEALVDGSDYGDADTISQSLDVVKNVIFTECACEAVLDAAEFTQEMTEGASKEDIDPQIKPIIELLNRLGYKTKYSSAGYRKERSKDDRDRNGVYYGKLYTTARITFDKNYKFDKLPKGWYQNFNSDTTGIYVKPFTYNEKDGTPDEAFSKWKAQYIEALKDWAENLKEAKDTVDE